MKNFTQLCWVNLVFIVAIGMVPICGFAQNSDSIKSNKVSIGFNYSGDYSYRSLKATDSYKDIVEMYDSIEHAKYGSTFGISGIYSVSDKFSVSIGLLFADKGEKTKVLLGANTYTSKRYYYYLDIPVKADYFFYKNSFYATVGVSPNIFLSSEVKNLEENTKERDNSKFSTINVACIAGIGLCQQLSESWKFKSEIVYRRSLQSIMDSPIKRNLYSVGLNVGFVYKL
jgi:hypothetical protein